MDVVRYASKFEDLAAAVSYAFPATDYQYQARQGYRKALSVVVGADYAHDHAGYGPWPKEVAAESIQGTIWGTSGADADSQFDELAGTLRGIGLGKLFLVDQAGTLRWAYAKLEARPTYGTTATAFYNIPVTIQITRLSDWFDEEPASEIIDPGGAYTTFTLTNPGNAPVRTGLTFEFQGNVAGGYENLLITNVTTGQWVRWRGRCGAMYAAGTSRLRFDTSDQSVRFDPGAGLMVGSAETFVGQDGLGGWGIWLDAWGQVELGPGQAGLWELEPGDNDFVVQSEGTPNWVLFVDFYGTWE